MSVDKVESAKGRAKTGAEATPIVRAGERMNQNRRLRHSQEGRKRLWRVCAMEGNGRVERTQPNGQIKMRTDMSAGIPLWSLVSGGQWSRSLH